MICSEQALQPGGLAFTEAFPELGDVEREVYNSLVEMRCAPFLLSYLKVAAQPLACTLCNCERMHTF